MNLVMTVTDLYQFDIYHTVKKTARLSSDGDTVVGEYVSDQFWVYIDNNKDTVHNTLKEAEHYIQEYHQKDEQ
jgi:hypothetical protein